MFDDPSDYNHVELLDTDWGKKIDHNDVYQGVDLVVAVPVCSGLSASNTADHGKSDSVKNNNLKFLANFTLHRLQPKVYIFENAPNLFTNKGGTVRAILNKIGKEAGYNVMYIKTDTRLHDNVQHRPRTFVIYIRKDGGGIPKLEYENNPCLDVASFLDNIPAEATQNDDEWLMNDLQANLEYQFVKKLYGAKWREKVGQRRLKSYIIGNGLADQFAAFHNDEKLKAHYEYCQSKLDINMGYYDRSFFCCSPDVVPTIYHGNTWSMIHPTEDRTFTFRELMKCMGMPNEYEYLHDLHSFGSVIGQNVPARTVQHWVGQLKTAIENWGSYQTVSQRQNSLLKSTGEAVYFLDNIHQRGSFEDVDF
jgi:DNA (cytosine-5)-methyltransferase 1